jgi:hypothetical protein
MIIRSQQMEVFETAAEDDFVQRLKTHLLENYAKSVVRLPDTEAAVDELPEETLDLLVRNSIERARKYDLSFESSISAFSAIRFDVAPNFDGHSMSKLCLTDETMEPNARLNELLKILTDEHWEKMRNDYDVNDWQEKAEDSAETQDSENIEKPENLKESDFAETVMNVGNPEKPEKPVEVKKSDFAETVMNIDTPKKPEKSASDVDFGFLDTVLNIDTTKE